MEEVLNPNGICRLFDELGVGHQSICSVVYTVEGDIEAQISMHICNKEGFFLLLAFLMRNTISAGGIQEEDFPFLFRIVSSAARQRYRQAQHGGRLPGMTIEVDPQPLRRTAYEFPEVDLDEAAEVFERNCESIWDTIMHPEDKAVCAVIRGADLKRNEMKVYSQVMGPIELEDIMMTIGAALAAWALEFHETEQELKEDYRRFKRTALQNVTGQGAARSGRSSASAPKSRPKKKRPGK